MRDHAGYRDGGRTPMPWDEDAWSDPWLPVGDQTTVAAQRADPDSTLTFTRDLIMLRRAFVDASYEALLSPAGAWAYRRSDHLVALNLGAAPVTLDGIDGTVAIGTDRSRDGGAFDGRLAAYEAVVIRPESAKNALTAARFRARARTSTAPGSRAGRRGPSRRRRVSRGTGWR